MEIAGILTAGKFLSTALEQLGKRSPPQEARGDQASETPATPVGPPVAGRELREILARYDVTDISPGAFSEMIRKLHQAGVLTDQEFQELSLIRVDLDLAGLDPDRALNLVDFYVDKLSQLRQWPDAFRDAGSSVPPNGPAQLALFQRRLQWLAKFATIQSAPDGVELDALA